jgi:hypothetical protein
MKRPPRSPKSRRPIARVAASPRVKRRQRSAKAAVRRGTTVVQSDVPRRVETRKAPAKFAERQHARPGAGIKRSRGTMSR